jgi:fluoroacetyl-CoA thioesterase
MTSTLRASRYLGASVFLSTEASMKPEVKSGVGIVEVIVGEEHTAVLDGRQIHPVFSTFWLAYFAEVAARRAIEPYFESGENAIGGELSLRHTAMAAVGERVTVRAEVARVSGRKIICEITATASDVIIAAGSQTQIVLQQPAINALIREAYSRVAGRRE